MAALCLSVAACHKQAAAQAASAVPKSAAATPATGTTPSAPAAVKPVPATLPAVVARVNGEDVSKTDLDRMLRNMELRAGQPIPPDRRDEIVRQSVDQLVTYTLLAQEARHRKMDVTEQEVDAHITQMQAQFGGDPAAFAKALAQRGSTLDLLKKDVRNDLIISKMMDADAATQPAPTDQDARAFYQKNPDKFQQPESVRASHILIRVDPKADAATKQKARREIEAVLKQARAGADFAKLAREHSQDGSAAQGGDLNYFTRGQMVPAFDKAAFALKPGQLSGIVESPFGYHIIKVTDHKPARTIPFEEASARITQYLADQRRNDRADAFVAELRKSAKIEVLI